MTQQELTSIEQHLTQSIQFIKGEILTDLKGFFIFIPSVSYDDKYMTVHGHIVSCPIESLIDTYLKLQVLLTDLETFAYKEVEWVEGGPFDENKRVMVKLMKEMKGTLNFGSIFNTSGLSILAKARKEGKL